MNKVQSLCHSVWDRKYRIVWIPKCRRKVLYGRIRQQLGEAIRELARQCESLILEGHLCSDHVQLFIAIPPKFAVAQVVGYIKGNSAIHIARTINGRTCNFTGENFWVRGSFPSTVGRDEEVIRNYIRRQEVKDSRVDQLELLK